MKEEQITLKLQDIEEIWQAGNRRGYSQRSIMAGAQGTNEPDFKEWLSEHFPQFIPQFEHLRKY